MNESIKSGVVFGLTSGVITTLGLIVGLHAGTHSRLVVVGGIFTIAVADALSDALGMHLTQESEGVHTVREVWVATAATFSTKFLMAMTFIVPVLLLELSTAILVSVVWGFVVLAVLSYLMARFKGERPAPVVGEHLVIAALVVALTHGVGDWAGGFFGG